MAELYSAGGMNFADTTAPLKLAYDSTGDTDVVFAVSSSGDLTVTPDGTKQTLKGSVIIGDGSTGVGRTGQFLYIPTVAGVPTGTPAAESGRVALVFDTTNDDLYVYDGSWIKVALA